LALRTQQKYVTLQRVKWIGVPLQIDANDLVDDLNLGGITRLGISKFAARDLLKIYTIMPLSVMPAQAISNGVELRFLSNRLSNKQVSTPFG